MPAKDHTSRTDIFRLEDFLPYRLAVMTDHVVRVFAESYATAFDLTIPEWRILAVVAEYGALSPTVAGVKSSMDKVKVTRAAQGLMAKGLLRQTKDPHDGRGRILRLSRKGQSAYAGMVPLAAGIESRLFDNLTRTERAAFEKVLTRVMARLEAAGPEVA